MFTMKALFFGGLVLLLLPAPLASVQVKAGQPAPAFAVKTIAGKTFRLKDYRGKVVLLDFWGVPCPPCRIQMPVLQQWHRRYRSAGLVVVGIEAMGSEKAAIRRAAHERTVTYALAPDHKSRLQERYHVTAHPTTILIDRQGRIAHIEVGYVRGDEMEMEKSLVSLLHTKKAGRQ